MNSQVVDAFDFSNYEVSNCGNLIKTKSRYVRHWRGGLRLKKEKLLTLHKSKTGYIRVGLVKDGKPYTISVHRLVWQSFNGKIPDGLQINHINGVKNDNRLVNLELMTCSENNKHKYDIIGYNQPNGEKSSKSNITKELAQHIIDLYKNGNSKKYISSITGVHYKTVYNISNGVSWPELDRSNVGFIKKTGVFFDKSSNKWMSQLTSNGIVYKKRFPTEQEAIDYRKELELKYLEN